MNLFDFVYKVDCHVGDKKNRGNWAEELMRIWTRTGIMEIKKEDKLKDQRDLSR